MNWLPNLLKTPETLALLFVLLLGTACHSHDDHGHEHDDDHSHTEDHEHAEEDHGHEHAEDEHNQEHGEDEHGHEHGEDEHGHEHADDEHGHEHADDEHGHKHAEDEHSHDEDHGHEHGDDHSHGDNHGHDHGDEDSWAVTAFGERYEIFAEADPLVAGGSSRSHTHVTLLDDFQPLHEGTVEVVLSTRSGRERVFSQNKALRPGIFDVQIEPTTAGTYELAFRISGPAGVETIPAGRVEVGTEDGPGDLIDTPFAPSAAVEGVDFLKEEQWRTAFGTAWAERGALATSVRGPAVVRPPAGGEVVLTAPVAGTLALPGQGLWPHPGVEVKRGQRLFALVPRRTDATTPAALEAEIAGLKAELGAARARGERLVQLLEVEAVSRREVEEATARTTTLEAQLEARRSDLAAERAARRGGREGAMPVLAPFTARVAEVDVSPGQTVAAGDRLGRLVLTAPLWVEVRLSSADAARLSDSPQGLLLHPAGSPTLELGTDSVRLVARHPEVDASSGTVGVLLEIPQPPPTLLPGARVEAEVLLPTARDGLVVPRSALVDDAGLEVVYVQLGGESFERREVTVLARQGQRVLLQGVTPGERLVTRGGAAIRRAALIASGGGGHGHVH